MKIQLNKKRHAVSPVIATLLLIAIAVAAAIIVYAFVTGLIGGLTTSTSGLVVESGTLTVPSGTNSGSIVVTVKNQASSPITGITVSSDQALEYVNGAPSDSVWTLSGLPVGGVPIGSSFSQQSDIFTSPSEALTAGTTYTFTVTVTFSGGGTNVQTLSLTAQV